MFTPSLTDTLTREESSVLNASTPASGAFTAGVKEGPDKIVKADVEIGKARIVANARSRGSLRANEGWEVIAMMEVLFVHAFTQVNCANRRTVARRAPRATQGSTRAAKPV